MKQQRTPEVTLEKVGPDNLPDCGIGCIRNPKHEGFEPKVEWLQQRFAEGLRFLLFRDGKGKPLAFLECVPGEFAWRPVDAAGWLFVHCLWVYPPGQAVGGLGSRLIQACLEEARRAGARGVAAMVSEGPWMAAKQVFLRNGFAEIAESDRFQLIIHRLGKGPEPRFRNISKKWAKQRGLHIVSWRANTAWKSRSRCCAAPAQRNTRLPTTVSSISCGTGGCCQIITSVKDASGTC